MKMANIIYMAVLEERVIVIGSGTLKLYLMESNLVFIAQMVTQDIQEVSM
jgi:hypothetical protein